MEGLGLIHGEGSRMVGKGSCQLNVRGKRGDPQVSWVVEQTAPLLRTGAATRLAEVLGLLQTSLGEKIATCPSACKLYREDGRNTSESARPSEPTTQGHHPGEDVTEAETKSRTLGATCCRACNFYRRCSSRHLPSVRPAAVTCPVSPLEGKVLTPTASKLESAFKKHLSQPLHLTVLETEAC